MSLKDNRLNAKICPECRSGILDPHQELVSWVKCSHCGFSKLQESDAKPWKML